MMRRTIRSRAGKVSPAARRLEIEAGAVSGCLPPGRFPIYFDPQEAAAAAEVGGEIEAPGLLPPGVESANDAP